VAFRDAAGGPATLRAVALDVTERRRAEDEQAAAAARERRTRALLDTLVAAAPAGVGFLDRDFAYVHVNDRLAALNGRAAAEHPGRTVREVLPEPAAVALESLLRRVLATGEPLPGVRDPRLHGGMAQTSVYPVRESDGSIVGLAVVVDDASAPCPDAGEAAARLAASFNDVLTAVGIYAELGQARVPHGRPGRRELDRIGDVVARGRALAAGGGGATVTVLLVDDEAVVRELVERILDDAGYAVLVASGGAAALELLAGTARIDLLLTDVVMPEMDGLELARRALALRPCLPVLFTSGFSEPRPPAEQLIEKPFRPAELLARIRNVLAVPALGPAVPAQPARPSAASQSDA
jgi:CheY-like chemotaxis protein